MGKTMWRWQSKGAAGAKFGEKSSLQEAEKSLLGEVWGWGGFLRPGFESPRLGGKWEL